MDTIVDRLDAHAVRCPDKIAFRFLRDGEDDAVVLTYRELHQQARRVAATLLSAKQPVSRAVMLYPSGVEFVTAFFGCLYAGVVAVPVYPPVSRRLAPRLNAILDDVVPEAVLFAGEVNPLKFMERNSSAANPPILLNTERDTVSHKSFQAAAPEATQVAFLQYTSGSTSTPKGVMITHANLIANAFMLTQAFAISSDSTLVSWLPLYHDMGLMGVALQTVFSGATCVLMAPAAFLQKPVRWLRTISAYGGTHSAAPNFAYDLCVDRIAPHDCTGLDLKRWVCAANGAEPVRATTMRRFVERFAPHGFNKRGLRPCYGLAECTLLVAADAPEGLTELELDSKSLEGNLASRAAGSGRWFIACGDTTRSTSTRIVIVDVTTECAVSDGSVGEIWVSGPQVARGYFRRDEETAHTFQARLADTGEGPFLRTGDLGFLLDGKLFVTGRRKDLLIFHGQNHYPQDIELTVEASHAALVRGRAAAFALEQDGGERLAIAVEVRRECLRKLDADEVVREICRAVAREHELAVQQVALLKPGALPLTSSGKVRRSACRDASSRDELETISSWRADAGARTDAPVSARHQSFVAWMQEQLAARLKCLPADVEPHKPLSQLGLTSLVAIDMATVLTERLGREVQPTVFYEHPTIAELAIHLGETEERSVQSTASASHVAVGSTNQGFAIVGMACRFPGARDLATFYENLCGEVDSVTAVPADRWRPLDGTPVTADLFPSYRGGFLDDVLEFDARFFGLSAAEAAAMDPQQRQFLEVTQSAIDDAGMRAEDLRGSDTGVFVGLSTSEYAAMFSAPNAPIDSHTATGCFGGITANRVSYLYDLRGPSFTVDAVCSSGLLALHLACQSMAAGECEQAIVGGVVAMLTQAGTDWFAQLGVTSRRGRCSAFDASADGIVLGEGVASLVLKPLARAINDGDRVYAVIRGSATTQDGRSQGLTAPTQRSQEKMLKMAYARANVAPHDVTYVDAHGTGTLLGDPIEAQALGAVLGRGRDPSAPLLIGSVKTNIGHCSIVGGLASLIKVALSINRGVLPASLHFEAPNRHVDFDGLGLQVVRRTVPWPTRGVPRSGGVTALSFGGTNVHVVVGEAPQTDAHEGACSAYLLPLSAKTPSALARFGSRYLELAQEPSTSWRDVCFTAATRRSHHTCRIALVFRNAVELVELLSDWLSTEDRALEHGRVLSSSDDSSDSSSLAPLIALGRQYVSGRETDFTSLFASPAHVVSLPEYPWEHERYWPAFSPSRSADPQGHGLFTSPSAPAEIVGAHPLFSSEVELQKWLREQAGETLQVPATSIDCERPLFEYGLTSLSALELAEKLREVGVDYEVAFEILLERENLEGLSIDVLAHRLMRSAGDKSRDVIDWEREASLDLEITPSAGTPRACSEYERVFLSGATGFLGAFLLDELLARTRAEVFCLVRASDEVDALRRIERNLRHYGTWQDQYQSRIRPVVGDLSHPLLGLSRARFDELAAAMDAIYHNGAHVTYALRYEDLRAPNVMGTHELCRFAAHGHPKSLHFVSSLGLAFPPRSTPALEDADLGVSPRHPLGYLQSKWVCEKMLADARARGMHVSIYRPSWIGGSTASGACNTEDWLCMFLKGLIELGLAPRVGHSLDIVPVDYIARAIVELSLRADSHGKNFNLAHPDPASLQAWIERLRRMGYTIESAPLEAWKRTLQDQCPRDNPLFALRSVFLDKRSEIDATTYEYYFPEGVDAAVSCSNTLAHLESDARLWADMARVDPFPATMKYLIDTGFIRAPLESISAAPNTATAAR